MSFSSGKLAMIGAPGRCIFVGGAILPQTNSAPTIPLTSLTGGIASAAEAGDLVLAMLSVSRPTNLDLSATGYTEIADLYSDSGTYDANLYVGRKFIASDTSVAFGVGGIGVNAVAGVSVWRGVDRSSPLDVSAVPAADVGTDRPDPGSITPVTPASQIVVIGAGAGGNAPDLAQAGSELSNFLTDTESGGNYSRLAFGNYGPWLSGTFDPAAFVGGSNASNNAWAAVTLALRPA